MSAMKLDEKALNASCEAYDKEWLATELHSKATAAAIRAYLEAATPPDVAKIARSLEALAEHLSDQPLTHADSTDLATIRQAAAALRLSAGGGWIDRRKFYHHGYSTAELLKARKSPPEFFTDNGEAWRYEYTHADGEGGAYDMLYRPASPTVEAGHVE